MKAFIINMPHDTARRHNMESVLSTSPFKDDYEFINGVNGRAMDARQLRNEFDYEAFGHHAMGRPTQGEIGCTLSHHKIWQKIAEMTSPAVVLEDDLHFEGSWDTVLKYVKQWMLCDEPRVLLLPRHFFYRRGRRFDNATVARPIIGFGTECYFINPAGARHMLGLGKPFYIADDWDYFQRCGLQAKAIIPHPIVLDEDKFASNIDGRSPDRLPWRHAAASVIPETFTFGYRRIFHIILQHKLHLLKKYLSPTEQ